MFNVVDGSPNSNGDCFNGWRQCDFFPLESIAFSLPEQADPERCMQYARDLWSTQTGNALLTQVDRLAQEQGRQIEIAFTVDNEHTDTDISVDGNIEVVINPRDIKADRYAYLIRREIPGDSGLAFVSVYHPPSVVLGHELGHVRQFLEHSIGSRAELNNAMRTTHTKLLGPAVQRFCNLVNSIRDQHKGPALSDSSEDALESCARYIAAAFPEAKGPYDPILEGLYEVFSTCFCDVWNGGEFCELPNIVPLQRSGGVDDFNPTIADGIFLREILEKVDGMGLEKGDDRRPAFFEISPQPGTPTEAQAGSEARSTGLSESDDRIQEAFRASTAPWLRWSHSDVGSLTHGQVIQTLRQYPKAKQWLDGFIIDLYTQPDVGVNMQNLPVCTQPDVGVKMEDLPVCPPLPQWPLRDSTLWPI